MYIVCEIQTTGEQVATLVTSYADRLEAESKYHTVLASAAISSVPKHGALMFDEDGNPLMRACYHHTEVTA